MRLRFYEGFIRKVVLFFRFTVYCLLLLLLITRRTKLFLSYSQGCVAFILFIAHFYLVLCEYKRHYMSAIIHYSLRVNVK